MPRVIEPQPLGASDVLPTARGLITTETHDAIEGLNVLRNLAAHGAEKDLSPQRAQEFTALAQGVGYAITTNAKRESR